MSTRRYFRQSIRIQTDTGMYLMWFRRHYTKKTFKKINSNRYELKALWKNFIFDSSRIILLLHIFSLLPNIYI